MAYATKYLFKWESVNGTTREIRVLLDGYSGSVVQRRLGRAPVLKKQHNGNVYGTSLEFYAECAVDGEFAEFYTTDPKAYRVDLYSGNTLLWQGYITPELYAEPDIAPPYDVQVIATDGVGELKLYDFAPQGLVSLRSMLTYLLGYTGLTTDVYLISSIKPGGSGAAGSLLEKTINLDYMAGESCYEVLSYILDTLHATITWWKGAWILARETNVKFSSGKVQYFNTSGNAGTLAGSVVTLGKMYTNDAWPVGQLSSKIDPAKNSVRIQAPWHPVTALSNPDMTSDTGWTKAGGAVYDSTNKGYHLPEASLSAIPRISQTLALSSLKNPMTLAAKVTGVSADLSLSTLFTAAMGFYVTYEVSGTTYHLERSDEGLVWKQGAMPSLLNYTNTIFTFLKTFDEDRTGAQTVDIEIPPFLLNSAFPAGTLAVYVFGGCVRVYGASLDVIISKGYQDNLYLDNDARGEGDEVEIAIGRETSAISPYQAFLQGILLDSGSLITSFKDDYITSSGLDFMSFIARDYARSFALPRIVQTGTVSLESSVTFPPLVFTKGALDYWLEGYSWNMLDDELDISARSLPTATITVDSETVTEAGGTAGSAAQGGSSSGGGSMPSGVNYFEQDDQIATLVKLKAAYSYLGPKKGLIFDQNSSEDANAHLEVVTKTIGGVATPVLHSRLPFYSDGFVSGGGMSSGGGTGGIDLDAMWTSLTTTSDAHGTDKIAAGHIPDMSSTYGYLKSADLSAYATRDWVGQNYLPLSGGKIEAQSVSPLIISAYGQGNAAYLQFNNATTILGYLGMSAANSPVFRTSSGTNYTLLHANNYDSYALPKSGGTITSTLDHPLTINGSGTYNYISFEKSGTEKGGVGFYKDSHGMIFQCGDTYINLTNGGELKKNNSYTFLHSNNYSSYALPLTGGTLNGTVAEVFKINTSNENNLIQFQSGGSIIGDVGYVTGGYGMILRNRAVTGLPFINIASDGNLKYNNSYLYYHSGNSNKSDVAWACSTLTTSGVATFGSYISLPNNTGVYFKNSGGTIRSQLYVDGSNNTLVGYGASQDGGNTTIYGTNIIFATSSSRTESMRINSSGNVGIGTTAPAYKLDVSGAASATYIAFPTGAYTNGIVWDELYAYLVRWSDNVMYLNYDPGLHIRKKNNNGTVIYCDDAGQVGIGTSSPYGNLHIAGTSAQTLLRLSGPSSYGTNTYNYVTFGTDNVAAIEILWGSTFKSPAGDLHFTYTNGMSFGGGWNAVHIRFTSTGNVVVTGAVTAGSASDVRLKTNINTMSDEQAKSLIMALRPVTFTWKQRATELYDQYKGDDLGFVAQEVEGVQNIVPGLSKAIGTIFDDYKRLDPVKFIAPMVKVAQNHETRIQQLERELAQVKSENKILRDRLNMS